MIIAVVWNIFPVAVLVQFLKILPSLPISEPIPAALTNHLQTLRRVGLNDACSTVSWNRPLTYLMFFVRIFSISGSEVTDVPNEDGSNMRTLATFVPMFSNRSFSRPEEMTEGTIVLCAAMFDRQKLVFYFVMFF
eukprot:GHVS01065169.1.p1 GENE.GHVS01065169.1~~GHVS01065169.1.p1  ORF type:complete len:135 (+),score=4.70 GHVS01065169.1:333-737(+)